MRIVIDTRLSQIPRGGGGLYAEKIVQALATLDKLNDYYLILNPALPLAHVPDQPNFHRLFTSVHLDHSFRRELWEQFWLPGILWRLGADVYHGFNFSLPVVLPCSGIATVYDLSTCLFPHLYRRLTRWRQSLFIWLATRRAKAVITTSHATRQDFVRLMGCDPGRVYVIYPALDPEYQATVTTGLLSELKARFAITKDYVIHIGMIHPRKNVPRLIEAFALANRRLHCAYQLIQVGEQGWQYQETLERIERLALHDDVRLTGRLTTPELHVLLKGARALIFPSLYEGFGIPLLEAMACQVPIVTSNVSSLPEVVGQAALLVDPLDVEGISVQIERILIDEALRANLIIRGQERLTAFDWRQSAQQLLEVYHQYAR